MLPKHTQLAMRRFADRIPPFGTYRWRVTTASTNPPTAKWTRACGWRRALVVSGLGAIAAVFVAPGAVVFAVDAKATGSNTVARTPPADFVNRLKTADAHFDSNRVHENFALLDGLYTNDGVREPELLWRYARAHYQLSNETTKKDEAERLARRGLELINQAKPALPNNFNVYKWQGILLGKMGEFLPTKEKIANAYVIRDNFKKAIELNPADATSLYCMGNWCWNIFQISWVERQAASLLFGTPPTSSFEECEQYLMKAWSLDKDGIYIAALLGDMYASKKRYAEAKEWYTAASNCPAVSEDQKRQVAEAKAKASKY